MSGVKYAEGECYLVVQGVRTNYHPRNDPHYKLQGFRVLKTKPGVGADEVAIRLHVKLPAALFEKPTLEARIMADGDVPAFELDAETVTTVESLIRAQTGLDVHVRVLEPEE